VTEGDTVTFDGTESIDTDGTIVSYEWVLAYNGTVKTLTGAEPTFDFEIAGAYTVTLTVTDDDGDTDTDTVVITVEAEELPPPTDDGKTFLESYGLPIAAIVVLLVVVVVAVLLLTRKKSG